MTLRRPALALAAAGVLVFPLACGGAGEEAREGEATKTAQTQEETTTAEATTEATETAERPELAEMALAVDDLPQGVSVEKQGYTQDENTVASYEREFKAEGARIGGSEVVGLWSGVDLFESDAEASAAVEVLKAESGRRLFAQGFSRSFAKSAGFKARDLEIKSVPGLGPDTAGIDTSFDTPAGAFRGLFFFTKVDRAVGSLWALGVKGRVDPAHFTPLLETLRERMEKGLAATS